MSKAVSTADFVNPFLAAVSKTFGTMIPVEVKRGRVLKKTKEETQMSGDISTIINFMGEFKGTAVISFPRKVAIFTVSKFLMDENITDFGYDVFDGVGEIGNLVCGAAKSSIATHLEVKAEITTPTVIAGQNHHFLHRGDAPIICIFYETEVGEFSIEVALRN